MTLFAVRQNPRWQLTAILGIQYEVFGVRQSNGATFSDLE